MKPLTTSLAIFILILGCQRKTTPAPKTCPAGQIKVGDNLCGDNPLGGGGGGLDTTPEPRPSPEPTPTEEPTRPEAPGGGPYTRAGENDPNSGLVRDPNISDTPYQPPAATPDEIAAAGGTNPDSVDAYKDLEVNVAIKALKASDDARGPLGLYVKLSKPELVSNIYVQYIKGEVIEGEKAFVPWDIFASIKFNAGAYLCEVSETRFDWETYRMKEPSSIKPVPYSCRRRSTN